MGNKTDRGSREFNDKREVKGTRATRAGQRLQRKEEGKQFNS